MTHEERVQRVADAMKQARIDGRWASAPDGENYACAEAAITASDETLEVEDEMVDAVYNLRWKGYSAEETGCAVNDAKARIRKELEVAVKAIQ